MVRANTKLNQWRSTADVIAWFNTLENKFSFIVFDVVDFYPSISENLLSQALNYASQFIGISQQQINIIMHSRKSFLFKRNNANMFDVAMGSYDGAEICELIGLFILVKLRAE